MPNFHFQTIPIIFKNDVISRALARAELAKFNQKELDSYENSLKIYRDLKGVIDTAFDEGKAEGEAAGLAKGEAKGKAEVARNIKRQGLAPTDIAELTGLSESEIEKL